MTQCIHGTGNSNNTYINVETSLYLHEQYVLFTNKSCLAGLYMLGRRDVSSKLDQICRTHFKYDINFTTSTNLSV